MRKLIINLLEAYIYIAIIITIGAIFYISDSMGINSLGIIIIYILLVPLIFGLIILAIDNNALLRDIRDNTPKLKKKNDADSNGKSSSEVMDKMREDYEKRVKEYEKKLNKI